MNLYLILAKPPVGAENDEDVALARWAGSQAGAASVRKDFTNQGYKRADIVTHEINVPTDKQGLMDFLNLLMSGPSVVAATEKLIGQ